MEANQTARKIFSACDALCPLKNFDHATRLIQQAITSGRAELLEVCEDAVPVLEIAHDNMGAHECTVDCPDISKHVARLRAAIAKAKPK